MDSHSPQPEAGVGPTAPPAGFMASSTVHVSDYVRTLYERRVAVLTVFALVVGAGVTHILTTTRVYQASTRLLIEPDAPNVVNFKEVVDQDRGTLEYYQTQYQILQSRTLAARTMDTVGLWSHPEFAHRQQPTLDRLRRYARESFYQGWNLLSGRGQPAPPRVVPTSADAGESGRQRVLDVFLSRLTIAPIRSSRLVDIRFQSTDPALAARVTETLARAHMEQSLEFKFTASKDASDWLGERLAEQRKQVEASEASLQRYREDNDAVSLEDRQNIVVQKLADLNAAVTRAKTQRIEKETLHNQLRSLQRGALDSFPAVLASTFIQQLKTDLATLQGQRAQLSERYGRQHPEILKLDTAIAAAESKLQVEISKVVQSVRTEFLTAQAQLTSLEQALQAQKQEAMDLNRKAIAYGVLERDAASSRQMFDSLLQRVKETGVSGALKTSNIRIVDHAVPPVVPVWPRTRTTLLVSVFVALLLSTGLAFLLEYLDTQLKSADEVESMLGLPVLALVPRIRPRELSGTALINNGVPAPFHEAFRDLRTGVLFSLPRNGSGQSLVVTSSGEGEGKTLVATNLAIALAHSKQRVLLIDADLRRPRVHDLFGFSNRPGLSDVLAGSTRVSAAMRRYRDPDMCVLPSGTIPPNPAEILGSDRFVNFISRLREFFDWVIIDSPPALAVTDPVVLARQTSAILFVVGAEMTDRRDAQAAVAKLSLARGKCVGVVMNWAEGRSNRYYSSYHHPTHAMAHVGPTLLEDVKAAR